VRKLRDLAAPNDPGAWYAVSNMWPTKRGTYETADSSTATELATNTGSVVYAFTAKTLASSREYVVSTSIYEYSAGALTDRTGGVAVGTIGQPMMAQYGDITIGVMGATNPTVKSSGGNFSALAGSPQGEIIVVQSNAVLVFNTNTSADGWAASDVGDYTNWATGEAASGRILTTPGPILAAVPFGNDVMVFKRDAIYRMTYVGGVVKWQVQMAWKGMGCGAAIQAGCEKYQVVACASGVAFNTLNDSLKLRVCLFDGASRPRILNPETSVAGNFGVTISLLQYKHIPVFFFDPVEDVLCIVDGQGSGYDYYSFPFDAWGSGGGASGEAVDSTAVGPATSLGVIQGDYYAQAFPSSRPGFYRYGATNSKVRRCVASAPASGSTCYLQSSMSGQIDKVSTWDRLTSINRRRTTVTSGTPSAVLELTLYSELEYAPASADPTRSGIAEATRRRFDLLAGTASAVFARFKVTWTDLDVEVDDFVARITSQSTN
jgi:hypothetical protein